MNSKKREKNNVYICRVRLYYRCNKSKKKMSFKFRDDYFMLEFMD